VPYLSASAVVIHYEEALYQVYAPLPFTFTNACAANDDSETESEDDSDTSDSDGEESDSEANGLDLDKCPPGCDSTLFDNTCLLRERRVDIEERLADERHGKDAMIRELDGMQKSAKVTESAAKNVEQELEAIQVRAYAFETD